MNDDILNNMEQKDLESLNLRTQNIIKLREKKVVDAIKAFDLTALHNVLKNNKEKILPLSAWHELGANINNLTCQNIDFFLFMRNLPQFKEVDKNIYSQTTITEIAVSKSFEDPELFNFFCNHKDFFPVIKEIADDYALINTMHNKIIHKLFQLKIFKPTKKLLNTVLDEDCFNYLEYFLDNNIYKFTETDYLKIYENIWKGSDSSLLNKIKKKFPKYEDIPLSKLIGKDTFIFSYSEVSEERFNEAKYLQFVQLDEDVFSRTLLDHKIDKNDVLKLVKAFDSTTRAKEENFHYFIQLVVKNYPEYCMILQKGKSIVQSSHLRKIYKKAMDYVELNIDLEKQPIQKKKLKL